MHVLGICLKKVHLINSQIFIFYKIAKYFISFHNNLLQTHYHTIKFINNNLGKEPSRKEVITLVELQQLGLLFIDLK